MAVAKVKPTQEPVGSKVQIKDLLAHMDPMIYLAGTADNTSEMLAYVSDMDPAFHKLEIVKGLRKELRSKLEQEVEESAVDYLEQQKGKMRADNPVDVLVEKMEEEEIYKNFIRDIEESVKRTVLDISEHFDDEIVTGMFSHEEDELGYNVSPNDSNESSLNSSLNQSGLLFLHPAQYNNIAQGLLAKKDFHAWNEGLNILISVTPGEPVMQDCWPDLKKGLRDCLLEESHEIFSKSLKVHSKLLTSQVQNAVKEAYLNLLEAVASFYMSKKLLSKIPLKGEQVDLKQCENIIRILKIITDFQEELPLLWIRYPERYVDDMVESTFNVLSLHVGKRESSVMNVFDILSLVDCDIFWFRRWVHGQWGRNKTFSAIKSNSMMLLYLVSYCIQYLELGQEIIGDANSGSLSSGMVNYLRFIQNLKLIMAIISYSDGRKLFPVNVPSREELVTVQGILQIFIKAACDSKKPKEVVMEIRNELQKYCSKDEVRCWILCDAGAVEILLHEVSCLEDVAEKKDVEEKDQSKLSPLFLKTVLSIFQSILSTQVGQRYILLGRKRKASSKSGLSTVTKRQAFEVMNLIHFVLKSEKANVHLKKKAVSVCCLLLSSPIGVHMCLEHPLIESVIGHLQKRGSAQPKRLLQGEDLMKMEEVLCLSDSHSFPLLIALISTYKGVSLFESEGVLSLVLKQVLPHMAKNGKINQKVLSCICTSSEGTLVIGELGILSPYWEIVCLKAAGEEPGQQPQKEEDKEEALMVAVTPLLAVTGTYYGGKLIFSKEGLLSPISHYLFSLDEIQEELHRLALYILGSATSSLDSMVYLQTSINYQEELLAQQGLSSVDSGNGSTIIIDEKSIIRNHILVKSYLLGGSGERILPPLVIESTSSAMPQLFSSYPPPRDYIPEKPIRSMHKKQNEVWRFLSDTRHGLHDIGWLNHCRKAVRSVLVAGEDIKNWLVMDIIERSARALLTSTEELLPGSPLSEKTNSSLTSPSPSSSPSSDSAQIPLPEYSEPQTTNENSSSVSGVHLAAVELIFRYGSELQLLTGSGSFKESLMEVLSYTQSKILCSQPERCDWFAMVMFLISGGNAERCRNVLSHISGVLVGGILWPCFTDSLSVTHELMPGEITFSGIIHNVQLVLSIEIPMLFSVIQANNSCVWNIIGEWIRCLFLGVLPWMEVCHYVMMVLLQGPDFAVYFIVAFLRHLQKIILKYTVNHKCLTVLQTSTITGWRIGEHLSFMEGLSRRHRRTVLPSLISPFYNLRHEYTPRQL